MEINKQIHITIGNSELQQAIIAHLKNNGVDLRHIKHLQIVATGSTVNPAIEIILTEK